MRINPQPLDTIVNSLALNRQQQNTALQELASGSTINAPSDNPVGAASVLQDTFQTSADSQYATSVAALQGQLQVADSTVGSVVTSLTQAIQLGTEGANGTLSDADRQSIAQEVQGIQNQLIGLANTQYQGSYIFGGTATTTPPYVADPKSPTGVTYNGNNGVNVVGISAGQSAPSNLPGSKLFGAAGGDVFKAINDLATALQSGTGIADATQAVTTAFSSVNTQRTFYGNTLARLNTTAQFLTGEQAQLQQNITSVAGADLAKVSSALVQGQTAQQAMVGAAYQVNQEGLIQLLH